MLLCDWGLDRDLGCRADWLVGRESGEFILLRVAGSWRSNDGSVMVFALPLCLAFFLERESGVEISTGKGIGVDGGEMMALFVVAL